MSPSGNRVSLITGAASGIGLATARRFAQAGDGLILLDRDSDGLHRIAEDTQACETLALKVDVADQEAVNRAVQTAVERFGRIDVLVNHAAVVDNWGPPADLPGKLWDEVLAVNLRGVVHTCSAVIPAMDRGSIINTASICGVLKPCANRAPYNAAKAALVAFTRDLTVAYGPRGIRANVVVPGFVDTPTTQRIATGHEAQADAERQRIPLRRSGRPEEVAAACSFLAGEDASYVNGSVLVVDGGMSLV